MEALPYAPNPLATAISSIGGLLPLILGFKKMQQQKAFQAQPLGTALGYEGTPNTVPTPGPMRDMPGMGATMPTATPTTGPDGSMTGTQSLQFLGAPPQTQPLLSQPVRSIMNLKNALGDTQMTNILAAMGVGRGQADAMQLEMGEDGSFRIKPGTKAVSSRNANVILRQGDLKNKKNLQGWRDAVESRLKRGQLAREETIALRADSDLLNFMLDPNFDMLDDTVKQQLTSQATAAINRLQQRGVKAFTGAREKALGAGTPTNAAPTVQSPAPVKGNGLEARWNAIKAKNPGLSDDEVDAQLAVDEASQGK